MILDNNTLFGDKLAYDGSIATIDLGTANPGKGKPIKCFFIAHSAMTSMTAIAVLDAAVLPADEAVMTVVGLPGVGETIEFELPSTVLQFVTIALTAAAAGNFSAGIVLEGNQTNV